MDRRHARSGWKTLCWSAALGTALAGPVVGFLGAARLVGAEDGPDRDSTSSVYVRDSAIAADKFELGKRMERLKEWHKSADVYQEILEKYRDRVVPVAVNEKQQPVKYASVTAAVQERLARWPDEGLTVYRTRYEPQAAALLEQAGVDDLPTLHQVLDQFFATDSARTAGIRLVDAYLEAGDFTAATWIGDRLLQLHPNLVVERPALLFRVALAHHFAGQEELATARAEELKAKHPNEIGSVAGTDVKLVDALAEQLAKSPPAAGAGAAADSWPNFGGDASRSMVGVAAGTPGARVYRVDLPGPTLNGIPEPSKPAARAAMEDARAQGMTINVMPVADRGELFFQDGERVYAVHVESGMPLSGWQQTYPNRDGRFALPTPAGTPGGFADPMAANRFRTPQQHTIAVTEDAVLAILGQPPSAMIRGGPVTGSTRLVCLERDSGRVRWMVDPGNLPKSAGNARNLSFSGSPLVVGDNVYAIARGSGAAVEDCHVLCFDVRTGQSQWSCYIASAQTAMNMAGGMPGTGLSSGTLSHLAFGSGRVFVLTNVGAVAAIDAYSGSTAWLGIYPRSSEVLAARQRAMMGVFFGGGPSISPNDSPKPWEFNPVMLRDGKVFALPTDGEFVHVYDAGSGEEIRRIRRKIQIGATTTSINMLLGVSGDRLLLCGDSTGGPDTLLCINWRTYGQKRPNDERLDETPGATFWVKPLDGIKGRPFVTQRLLYVPCESGLSLVDMSSGRAVASYPKGGAGWAAEEGPGNVLVSREHVVIANARNVSVYTDLTGVRQKYDLAVRENPGNVEARLIFSELMFNAGERKESLSALDGAIEVLGGLKAMRPGPLRERVFSDALLFAQRLAAEKKEASLQLATALFDRAAAAAATAPQQVNYRLSRAKFLETSKGAGGSTDYGAAVRLYQEILTSPEWRGVSLAADDGGARQAAAVAEEAITTIIRAQGPQHYAAFEREAADRLKAVPAESIDQLMALAEQYPNATSTAATAMMRAASVHERGGNPRMATQVLRRLYWKYASRFAADQRRQVVEAMARNYLRIGNIGAALGHLRRISVDAPDAALAGPLAGAGGKPLLTAENRAARTFREASDALARLVEAQRVETAPAVKLPNRLTLEERLAKKPWPIPFAAVDQAMVANVRALVRAPADQGGTNRGDRIIAQVENNLVCLAPGRSEPLWTTPAFIETALGLHWTGPRLIAWSEGEVALLDGEKGQLVWKTAVRSLPAAEMPPMATDAAAPQPAGPAIIQINAAGGAGVRILAQRIRLQPVAAVAAENGGEVVDDQERIAHVVPLSDRVVASTTMGRVFAVDLASGTMLWQMRLASGRAIQQTLANDDFVVVRLQEPQTAQLVVLDSFNGQQLHRQVFTVNPSTWPINCALSGDGMMVWTTPMAMAAKDLYEPGSAPTWMRPEQPNATLQPFAGMGFNGQLVVMGQQIVAVTQSGRFIERRSLLDGKPIGNPIGTEKEGAGDTTIRLRVAGQRVYFVGTRYLGTYHMAYETGCGMQTNPPDEVTSLPGEFQLSQDYALLPGMIATGGNKESSTYTLQIYSRAMVRTRDSNKLCESGLQVFRFDGISEPSKIKAWQISDGGIYYLTGDGNLRWLKGNGA